MRAVRVIQDPEIDACPWAPCRHALHLAAGGVSEGPGMLHGTGPYRIADNNKHSLRFFTPVNG